MRFTFRKVPLLKTLFLLNILMSFLTASTTPLGDSPPVPKDQWCAEPQKAKNTKTEASAECIECLFGKQLESPKGVAGLASLGEKIQEETAREKIEREALTYLILIHDSGKSLEGMFVDLHIADMLLRKYFRAKAKGETLPSKDLTSIHTLFSEDELNKLTSTQAFDLLEDRLLRTKISEFKIFKKKSIEELKNAILEMKKILKEDSFETLLCGHDDLEYRSIVVYTGSFYRVLNRTLRDGSPNSDEAKYFAPFVATMKKGLSKIKDYPHTVYRGDGLSQEELDKYKPGEVITLAAFTSTSRLARFSDQWGSVGLEIKSVTGKPIEHYSGVSTEQEVLLKPGTKLRVVKKWKPENSNRWRVQLEEVIEN